MSMEKNDRFGNWSARIEFKGQGREPPGKTPGERVRRVSLLAALGPQCFLDRKVRALLIRSGSAVTPGAAGRSTTNNLSRRLHQQIAENRYGPSSHLAGAMVAD